MSTNTDSIIKEVASQEKSIDKDKIEEYIQLIIFELDKEEYAVRITDIQEIKKIPDITPIPNAPEFITGIFNLRGKIIVIVDLEKRFNLERDNPEEEEKNLIITEVNKNNFGMIVDKVTEIINVPTSTIQATPALVSSKIHAEYLKGVVVIEEEKETKKEEKENESRLIILLDLHKMLQEKELLTFGQAIKEVIEK